MNWFIISRDFHVAATITTDNPTGLQIFDDTENTVIENNCVVGSYDFSVNNAHPDAVALEMGSYVVFYNKRSELKMYTLVTFDTDENIAKWHAEDVGMDLLQETAGAWNYAGQTHPIAWYLENLVLYDTGWTIGVNEVSELTRSLVYTGQSDTQLKRLGDVANAFDGAELTFTIRMEGNRVKEQLVNIRRKVGRVQTDTRYIDERNIKSLTSTGSIESLRTAMLGIGSVVNKPDGSQGDPLTFTNISYDDGNYYSPVGHNKVYDRNGRTKWSRFKAFGYKGQGEFDGYMVGTYSYDTEDANELLRRTLANLKTVNNPVVTYEAKLHEIDADIGDYLQMADNKYTPTLYLQARLVGISVCYTQDGLDVGVLGDYTKLQSAIDPRVQQMFDRLATTIVNNFTWTRYAEDANGKGMTAAPNIRTTHVAFLSNQKTGVPSDNPADYAGRWVQVKGDRGPKGDTGEGVPGTPGADGKTPYLHTAWANSFDGKDGFSTDVSTNKSYMGTYVNFTEADPTDPALYNWIELVGALVIGGRNYLLDTNTPWQMQGSGGDQHSSPKWLFTFGTIKQAPFNDGDYVTVSFDYINVGTGAYGAILPEFNNIPWRQFNGGEAMKDNEHVVRTVQWKSDWTTSGTATGVHIRMNGVATTRTVTVYNVQLESGNKATDHKVAPEDTQALIDSLSTPNLVYNAGLQGTYKNGLDGWAFGSSIPDKWYRASQPSSMIGGINALALNGSIPAKVNAVADSKPITVQAGNVVSASISMKIGTESGSSIYMAAEIHFTNDSGVQVGSNVGVGTVNNKTDYASFEIVNVSVPTGATRIGIRYYVHNNSSTSAAAVHAFWCKPVINYGAKVAVYTDNQGSGADITQTNDALIALNDVFDKTVVPVASITAPPSPKEGQGWWVLNAAQEMIGFKIYKNGAWEDAPIQQSAMNIGTLNGNIINGATINSSNFNVAFDETAESSGRPLGPYFKGTQVIKNGSYLSNYQVKDSTQTGYTYITPDGLQSRINNNDGSLLSQVTMGRGSLSLQDATNSGNLYPGDVERTDREVWTTSNPPNGDYKIGFMKQFRRVWLDGVVVLKPSNFPHYETLFTLKNKALWPSQIVFISMNELGGTPSTVATIQVDTKGVVKIIYSGTASRYIAEGHFYLLNLASH